MGTEKKTLVMDEAVLSVLHSSLPGVHRGGFGVSWLLLRRVPRGRCEVTPAQLDLLPGKGRLLKWGTGAPVLDP